MKHPRHTTFLLLSALVWAMAGISAFSLKAQGQRFIFEQMGNLGMVPEVFSLHTDEHGRVWYSTWGRGVFCFDGYLHKRYITNSDDPNSIPNDRIFSLLTDKRQRVWVGSLGGLSCIDRKTERVRRFDQLDDPNHQIQKAFEDKSGTIWLGAHNAIFRFDEATQTPTLIPAGKGTQTKGGRFRSFWEDTHGTLWASRSDGLYRFADDRGSYEKISPNVPGLNDVGIIYTIRETSTGTFLFGTQQGLFQFDRNSHTLLRVPLPDSLAFRRADAIHESPQGTLWVGLHGTGLLRWGLKGGDTQLFSNKPHDPGSLISNFIYCLTTDQFGNLWVGTSKGVVRINLLAQAFSLWPIDAENPRSKANFVVRMAEDKLGGLLVRTEHELHFLEKLGAKPRTILFEGAKIFPDDLFRARDGTLWIVAARKLFIWNPEQRRVENFNTPPGTDGLLNLVEDADDPNVLWLGTLKGLQQFDRRSGELRSFSGLGLNQTDAYVGDLVDDGRGSLWLQIPQFLAKFDKKTGTVQRFNSNTAAPCRLVANEILDLNLAPNGWVWVSTTGGITRIDPATGHFHNLTRSQGLADNVVPTVLFDQLHTAWIVTPEHIQRFEASTGRLQTFNTTDEFQMVTWTRGRCETREGRLLFAGEHGILSLNPARLDEAPPPSAILLTRFETSGGGEIRNLVPEMLKQIQLASGENNLSLEWAGIQTARTGALRYECKLERKGEKRDWEQKGEERWAIYSNLEPGAYSFQVRIVGSQSPELSLSIAIAPAWYQAEWFKMLLMALLVTVVYLFWRARENQRELLQQKELAEQNARYKTRFLANMSHEIRTPMNAILGLSRLLTESKLPPKQSEYADAIRQSSENLLVIVNDVLDQAKIESGKFKFQHKPFDLELIMRHLQNTLGFKAEEKGLRFEINIAPQTPTRLLGDPVRLNQILTNLLGNAIKFTEQGGIRLDIEPATPNAQTPRGQTPIALLQFSISDTGIGIESDQLGRVFESFQQADDDISANYGGTGLGLSITKDLVEQQGGTITLESELGQGTRALAIIPYTLDPAPRQETQAADQQHLAFENLRVLLVEDTFFNQMLAVELLRSRIPGVQVEVAENGQVALEKIESDTSYDLVLMDLKMPVMDGYEATRRLRTIPAHATLPIIALTANAVQAELDRCREVGMNAWVTKPIDTDELFATMHQVLNHQPS